VTSPGDNCSRTDNTVVLSHASNMWLNLPMRFHQTWGPGGMIDWRAVCGTVVLREREG
jgi:hypothetical protein